MLPWRGDVGGDIVLFGNGYSRASSTFEGINEPYEPWSILTKNG
jgi:hypothetical protein